MNLDGGITFFQKLQFFSKFEFFKKIKRVKNKILHIWFVRQGVTSMPLTSNLDYLLRPLNLTVLNTNPRGRNRYYIFIASPENDDQLQDGNAVSFILSHNKYTKNEPSPVCFFSYRNPTFMLWESEPNIYILRQRK